MPTNPADRLAASQKAEYRTIPWRCTKCDMRFEMPEESYVARITYRCGQCGEWAVLDGHQAVSRLLAELRTLQQQRDTERQRAEAEYAAYERLAAELRTLQQQQQALIEKWRTFAEGNTPDSRQCVWAVVPMNSPPSQPSGSPRPKL
jgi:hypothetical protein